jgi:hypothetical protein
MTSGRSHHLVQAVLPVDGGGDVEPLKGEVDGDELTDHLIVVNDQHSSQSLRHGREGSVSRRVLATTWPR